MSNVPYHSSIVKNYKTYENSFLPKIVHIPIAQECDYEYKIVVKKGDVVEEGDVIASYVDSEGNCVNIHSSIPGTVLDFVPTICPNGKFEYSIQIQLQGSFKYLGKKKSENNVDAIFPKTILSNLIDKGVVNTFLVSNPVNLGFEIKNLGNKVKNLVVRLCDEDEYRLTDSLMSKFFIQEILIAVKLLAKTINAQGVLFVVNKKFENLKELQDFQMENARILTIDNKTFPCGFKRDIINSFNKSLKKSVPFKITKNDLYVDSSTLYEVYKAVILELPSIEKFVHITGNCIYSSCLLNLKMGTSINDVIKQIGGYESNPAMVVVNGSQTGTSVSSLDVPITKYTKSVSILANNKITDSHIYSCVNCGNCRLSCPANICPDILYKYAIEKNEIDSIYLDSVSLCNECGLCNTVCPARLPLGQMITTLKSETINKGKNQNEE